MPSWQSLLSDADIDAVAEYVRSFGPHREWGTTTQIPSEPLAHASVQDGRELFVSLGCPACHGAQGRGDGTSAKFLQDSWKQPDPPRDLTAPWTFRAGSSPEALYARIACGMSGTPMPEYAEVAEPAQIAAVVAYIRSIARPAPWEAGGTLDGIGASADPVRRGDYLVHAGMCGLCHTPVDKNGIYLADTHYLAGGMRIEAGAHGVFFSRNLTSDPETGLGRWTVEQIATVIRTGHTPERRLNFWGMPWQAFGALTPEDAAAMAAYLKTLQAVRNRVPPPLYYGFVETVARKLLYPWPTAAPRTLTFAAGNFGDEQPVQWPRELPQQVLVWAQRVVWMLGIAAGLTAGRTRQRRLRLQTGRRIALFVPFALLVIGFVIDRYPAIERLPAEPIVDAFAADIPAVATTNRAPHEVAMLQRGHYLYGIASCAFCHGANGAGGSKLSWGTLGTTWARNLTAHPSGLRDWSDDDVLRAMVSGVSRDGRALHWQAMIWDHLSNYSIEDQRALLAYVRTLPAIDRPLPQASPPNDRTCATYTFWVRDSDSSPDCR